MGLSARREGWPGDPAATIHGESTSEFVRWFVEVCFQAAAILRKQGRGATMSRRDYGDCANEENRSGGRDRKRKRESEIGDSYGRIAQRRNGQMQCGTIPRYGSQRPIERAGSFAPRLYHPIFLPFSGSAPHGSIGHRGRLPSRGGLEHYLDSAVFRLRTERQAPSRGELQ